MYSVNFTISAEQMDIFSHRFRWTVHLRAQCLDDFLIIKTVVVDECYNEEEAIAVALPLLFPEEERISYG